uniref:Uncharacterized protein n=1 Tax=Knipowitschia caucasica TaxID=637954 RepID=A0AAV2JBC4_KNICA
MVGLPDALPAALGPGGSDRGESACARCLDGPSRRWGGPCGEASVSCCTYPCRRPPHRPPPLGLSSCLNLVLWPSTCCVTAGLCPGPDWPRGPEETPTSRPSRVCVDCLPLHCKKG